MDDNWIVENLENALATWNEKLAEIWQLVSMTPQEFKGGGIWNIVVQINGALQAIGYGLLVLFFAMGLFKNTVNFQELRRPEAALRYFLHFVAAKAAVTYCMPLMLARVRYMRRHCKHGGRADGRYGGQRGHIARRDQRGHRKRGFSRVHPAVARDDFGQPVHYRAFLYPDHDGV